MSPQYLEVTYRRGKPLAAYLYLPRRSGDKSFRTEPAAPGMVIDFHSDGRPIGIEITAPTKTSLEVINAALRDLGLPPARKEDLAPLWTAQTK